MFLDLIKSFCFRHSHDAQLVACVAGVKGGKRGGGNREKKGGKEKKKGIRERRKGTPALVTPFCLRPQILTG